MCRWPKCRWPKLTPLVIAWYVHFMKVSLTGELEELINEKLKTGLYHTASEVICDGLRLLKERDQLYQVRLEELRGEVKKGLDQLDRGEGVPFDPEVLKRRLRQYIAKKKRAGTA